MATLAPSPPLTALPAYTAVGTEDKTALQATLSPSYGLPAPAPMGNSKSTVMGIESPGMVLVERSSRHSLRFLHLADLKAGRPVVASFAGVHSGQGLGRKYSEQRKYEQWRYTESALGSSGVPITIRLDDGFLVLEDTIGKSELVFDVAFWNYKAGNHVNFVGGPDHRQTRLKGGGKSWQVNADGTISLKKAPHLVLGAGVEINANDLEGCWSCCCFPCGCAKFKVTSEGKDEYTECGIFCFLFVLPLPYGKRRHRTNKNSNTFINAADANDRTDFFDAETINPGPYKGCLWG
ncbi:hypothetical protein TrRE_jg5872, partial [Triparma retinervis]